MMRAIVQHGYGGPERLQPGEVELPRPGDGEVLVRVRAAGVDRGVWHLMTGTPLLVRPVVGWRGLRQPVPGGDLAGVVESVGDGVTEWTPGDEVFGFGRAAFAEFAVARADRLARKPARIGWADAAAVPVSGVTALQALGSAGVGVGSRVLVIGAGGGVGTFAVQLAAHLGAEVTAATSAAKADLVRSLGAHAVVDYGGQFEGEYDAVLDIGGRRPLNELRRLLTRGGTVVFVGGEGGGRLFGGMERNLVGAIGGRLRGHRFVTLIATSDGADLRELRDLLEAGHLRSVVAGTHPLEHAAQALRELELGPAGKLALLV